MTVALRDGISFDAFLEWEERQPDRWEFDGFAPVAMVGGTSTHNLIITNVAGELRERLRGGPCKVYAQGMKISAMGSIRYPDVFVTCGPTVGPATVAENPVVVFEVLSPGSAGIDVVIKNREYRATPSIMRYVLLAQDSIGLTMHERRGEDWLTTSDTDPNFVLHMPEIGVIVPMAAFYEGVF